MLHSVASVTVTRLHKEVGEPLQRVLVHGIHYVEVPHAEVHNGSSVGYRTVPLAALIDFLLRHLSFCNLPPAIAIQQPSVPTPQTHLVLSYLRLFSNDGTM